MSASYEHINLRYVPSFRGTDTEPQRAKAGFHGFVEGNPLARDAASIIGLAALALIVLSVAP